jgi:predicted membrane-bound spermidine synthase
MPITKPQIPAQLAIFTALFLISGAAGLIYEIIWERLLELYFGVTMTSITLIVSAYMAGLGLGSLFGGRLAQKLKSPLSTYGLLEIGIGLFGLISPILLNWIGRSTAGSPYWLVFILSFAFLLAPTFLMGTTLPLLSQAFINRVEKSGQVVGLLYGINTLGAAFGCLLAGYVLIGKFGFDGASLVAVAFNIGVGLAAILASRWIIFPPPNPATQSTTRNTSTYWIYRQILFTSFLVGFIGLGFEMLWIRILHIINKNTSYGFASILFVFLIGLAIGGYYWGRRADSAPDPEKLFWQVEIGVGIIASLVFLSLWISINTNMPFPGLSDFWFMQKPVPPFVAVNDVFVFSRRQLLFSLFTYFLPILVIVLPASFIMGGGLPILDRIAINSPEVAGRKVGDIHLANIIGSVFGSLIISFWMLPNLGTEWTHKALVLLGLTFPVFYFIRKSNHLFRDPASATVILATVALLFFLPGKGQLYPRLFETMTGDQAITLESSDSVITLTLDSTSKPNWLWIGGETNSFYPPDGTYESRGILCAGASQPKRVLIIGMGGGVAARFFQTIPDIQEIVIVELMTDLGDLLYDNVELTRPVFDDPRIRYIADDGRRYLYAHPNDKFDIIFADPLRWYSSGHNNLYSLEAMQLYQAHLTENGVFCAYVDQPHALPFTIAQVFPEADQFAFRTVIASNQQIQYNLTYMESIKQNYVTDMSNILKPGTEKKLSPKYLLSEFLRDREQIISDEKESPILSDLKPELEYYFFNPPIKKPIWLKGNFRTILIPRIQACDQLCQQEIINLTLQKP